MRAARRPQRYRAGAFARSRRALAAALAIGLAVPGGAVALAAVVGAAPATQLAVARPGEALQAPACEPGGEPLAYRAFLGGLAIGQGTGCYELDGGRFRISGRIETAGVAARLFPWTIRTESTGGLRPGGAVPGRYEFDSRFRDKPRHIAVAFGPEGARVVQAEPPLKNGGKRRVPPEATRGAYDPLSAFLSVGRALSMGESCNRTVRVFEGRWRYDLVVSEVGRTRLEASKVAPFDGEALECTARFRPVAGFDPDRDLKGDWAEYVPHVWFAPSGNGGPWIPVRAEVQTPFSVLVIHIASPLPSG